MSGKASWRRGRPCAYCTARMIGRTNKHPRQPTRDHAVPTSRGGLGGPVFFVCRACNQDKDNMTLAEWHAQLVADGDIRASIVEQAIIETNWNVVSLLVQVPEEEMAAA